MRLLSSGDKANLLIVVTFGTILFFSIFELQKTGISNLFACDKTFMNLFSVFRKISSRTFVKAVARFWKALEPDFRRV